MTDFVTFQGDLQYSNEDDQFEEIFLGTLQHGKRYEIVLNEGDFTEFQLDRQLIGSSEFHPNSSINLFEIDELSIVHPHQIYGNVHALKEGNSYIFISGMFESSSTC